MAQQIACDGCESEAAVTMITDMETGKSSAIGVMCLPVYHANALAALVDIMTPDAVELYAPLLTPLAGGLAALCGISTPGLTGVTVAAKAQAAQQQADSETTGGGEKNGRKPRRAQQSQPVADDAV